MKTLVISTVVLIIGLFVLSPTASAVNIFSETCGNGTASVGSSDVCKSVNSQNASGSDPILKILKVVINLLSYIIGIAAVIVLIVAAIQMIVGGDNAQTVTDARNMMIYAAVGILVAVLSQIIVVFVLDHLG